MNNDGATVWWFCFKNGQTMKPPNFLQIFQCGLTSNGVDFAQVHLKTNVISKHHLAEEYH